LVGVGIARFGYSPLIPAVIAAGWFGPSQAAYLGAANLAGYLFGALAARPAARHVPPAWLLRLGMAAITVSFLACGAPRSFAWFLGWRLVSGLAGGVMMVLAAPLVLPHVAGRRRGLAGGLIFTGVGTGVIVSALLVPRLLAFGLGATWSTLGVVCLVLTIVAWGGWPADPTVGHAAAANPRPRSGRLIALLTLYALDAVGIVPHMVFLVDYVARGLGHGIAFGAFVWVMFGIGAALGPVSFGMLGDRIGFGAMLRAALVIQAAAVALTVFSTSLAGLCVSGFIIGAFTPGIAPVMLGRIRELLPDDPRAQQAAWSGTTVSFGIGQAVAAYGLSAIFARSGYGPLFVIGLGALLLALAVELVGDRRSRAR
jgi:predicted MFS family arabinose efflux permease